MTYRNIRIEVYAFDFIIGWQSICFLSEMRREKLFVYIFRINFEGLIIVLL